MLYAQIHTHTHTHASTAINKCVGCGSKARQTYFKEATTEWNEVQWSGGLSNKLNCFGGNK